MRLRQALQSARNSASAEPAYCPDRGDIIQLTFDPQEGREQAGRRPALVLSSRSYNERAQLCVLCPMTNQAKGYPFEVADGGTGVVLADQVKSMSWLGRKAEHRGTIAPAVLNDVLAKVAALLQIE